jgi:predicted DNA-binding antitoxin AbrB/MazE fold protein
MWSSRTEVFPICCIVVSEADRLPRAIKGRCPVWINLEPCEAQTVRVTIMVVRLVEAQYENGVLRPAERLSLQPGERVKLIVMRRPDPIRWDLARLAKTGNGDDLRLAEQGVAEWVRSLEATERS